ncbi:MAG: transposase [Halorhodospira sp.]
MSSEPVSAHCSLKRRNSHPYSGGQPRVPDRRCMEGILFVLRTGSPWRSLGRTGIVSGSTPMTASRSGSDGISYCMWQPSSP